MFNNIYTSTALQGRQWKIFQQGKIEGLITFCTELQRGARRIRKKSYAKVFRASVRAETSRLPVCGSAARRNRRLG
ncbi:hypothetical protein EI015_14585 [Escherichia coli]|nr:hypothetical protein [Escherichia coli]